MMERWAIAYQECGPERGLFNWLRNPGGRIMIFASKWEAKSWVLTEAPFGGCRDEVLYIRLP